MELVQVLVEQLRTAAILATLLPPTFLALWVILRVALANGKKAQKRACGGSPMDFDLPSRIWVGVLNAIKEVIRWRGH